MTRETADLTLSMHPFELVNMQVHEGLHALTGPVLIENNQQIAARLYCSWDEMQGEVQLQAASSPDALLTISGEISGAPRWASLNIEFGTATLSEGDVLGIVIKGRAKDTLELPMTLRSAAPERDHRDTHLSASLTLSASAQTKVMLHKFQLGDGACDEALYHTLIVELPRGAFQLDILDLRIFVQPGQNGIRTLGNAA